MVVLGIESSCDETSVAIYDSVKRDILSSSTFSQADIHSHFGGVIPEVASRNHILKIAPLYERALSQAEIQSKDIDLISVTTHPGLIGALFVGVTFAKGLGYALNIPIVPINHLYAHILAAELSNKELTPPYLALVASGGHTHIFYVDSALSFRLLARSIDDAAGESFDKVAKAMGGGYPGGAFIEGLAKCGDSGAIKFPIAFNNELKFSFSGLKTAVINEIKKGEYSRQDIAASFQKTVAKTLLQKVLLALKEMGANKVVLGGGVVANSELRNIFKESASKEGFELYLPELKFCSDNADMIAYAGYRFYPKREFLSFSEGALDTKAVRQRFYQ